MSKYLDSIVHSSDYDLSINDLWSSFREELTYGIKRFKPHRLTSSRNGLPLCVPLIEMPHEETAYASRKMILAIRCILAVCGQDYYLN